MSEAEKFQMTKKQKIHIDNMPGDWIENDRYHFLIFSYDDDIKSFENRKEYIFLPSSGRIVCMGINKEIAKLAMDGLYKEFYRKINQKLKMKNFQ